MTPEQLEQETAACKAAFEKQFPGVTFKHFGTEYLAGWLAGKADLTTVVLSTVEETINRTSVQGVTAPGELSSADVPRDVLQAAVTIERYFDNRGVKAWQLRGIQSRWQPISKTSVPNEREAFRAWSSEYWPPAMTDAMRATERHQEAAWQARAALAAPQGVQDAERWRTIDIHGGSKA